MLIPQELQLSRSIPPDNAFVSSFIDESDFSLNHGRG